MADEAFPEDTLWDVRDLSRFLRYSPATMARMVSTDADRLPPRVQALARPRWNPATVRAWVADQSRRGTRNGRPRNPV